MRFYNRRHRHSCGIDLHVETLAAIEKQHGNGNALWILAQKIGRAVFDMLARGTVFSTDKFRAA